MQINFSNNISYGKMGKAGKKIGRNSRKLLHNPYNGKVAQLNNWYRNQTNLIYNSLKNNKDEEFALLNDAFYNRLAILEQRHGLRGKVPFEY